MKNSEAIHSPEPTKETLSIPLSDRKALHADLYKGAEQREKTPAILCIHGWMSKRGRYNTISEALSKDLGETVLNFDLRAHGENKGNKEAVSREQYLADVVEAYDFLVSQPGIDPDQIGVIGTSFGCYLATLLSSKRKVNWMALRAPADYPDDGFTEPNLMKMGQEAVTNWRKEKRTPEEGSLALKAMGDFKGKVLIVESEDDDQVPFQTVANYADAVKDQHDLKFVVLKDAGHAIRDPETQKEFDDAVLDFAKENQTN